MSSTKTVPITAIILTLNETTNIGPCLQTLSWADEIILVDSGSTDDTIRCAQQARPNLRVYQNQFQDFGQQRNWALDWTQPRHEWIFFVDADERITSECAQAIQNAVRSPGDHVGFFLCYRNIFLGRWIKRCTMFPSWQLRLLKKGRVRFAKEGHGQREVLDGPAGYIHQPYDHLDLSKGLRDWIDRHNWYSSQEVDLLRRMRGEPLNLKDLFSDPVRRRRCVKRIAARLGGGPVTRFVYLYLLRLGFLDGRAGYAYCMLRAAQQIHILAKLAESES